MIPVQPHGVVWRDHAVAVAADRMVAVATRSELVERYPDVPRLQRPDGILLPGLINAHTHNPMTLMRGVADDLPLHVWLSEHIWPT